MFLDAVWKLWAKIENLVEAIEIMSDHSQVKVLPSPINPGIASPFQVAFVETRIRPHAAAQFQFRLPRNDEWNVVGNGGPLVDEVTVAS